MELDRHVARREAADGLVERAHEEHAAELAVGDRVQADRLLLGDDLTDALVGDLADRVLIRVGELKAGVRRAYLVVTEAGLLLQRVDQARRAQEAADVVGPDGLLTHGVSSIWR